MKNKKGNKLAIFFCIMDLLLVIGLFILYGPFSFFRDFWISSAMTTASHKYLARIFYTEEMIEEVISINYTLNTIGDSDPTKISIGDIEEQIVYSSPYEEAILKRDKGNDLYKVIDISGSKWKGHIIAIYDPTRVKLIQSKKIKTGGQILNKMAESYKAVAAINASGFSRKGTELIPLGSVILDGKVVLDAGKSNSSSGIVGFNKDGVMILSSKGAKNAVEIDGIVTGMEFRPFLIINGQKTKFSGNGGWGIAPRTAIGQRKDGIVLFVVIDGRRAGHSIGISIKELADVMYKYGAYNASNLDGGGSSAMVLNGDIISVAGGYGYSGDRYLPNAWALIP